MDSTIQCNPAPLPSHAVAKSASGMQATLHVRDTILLDDYTVASLAYLDATAMRHHADAAMHSALAHAHRVDPFLVPSDRTRLASIADGRAESSTAQAMAVERRADGIRAVNRTASGRDTPRAVIVVTVQRDRIQQTARLIMGGTRLVSRTWQRIGPSSWKSYDLEWAEHEDRIGVELAEYMDALALPTRVAAMLPLPPSDGAAGAAKAAREVRRD